ncbi:MAG: GYD domain-containing protein [Acidobacteriia bacterium]|nr:GYD domain-containing protein [Terriglobia bacterium]
MPTYVLMTTLSPEVTRNIRNREEIGKEWKQRIANQIPSVKWIAHYALLGPYDCLDIYEAPDEEAAAKVSMISLALGALRAESWTAIPYSRFLELSKQV